MAAPSDYTPTHKVGETLEGGKYRLDTLLGAGTFGEVWKAMHVSLSTVVAIKILHWQITKRDAKSRFAQEARVSIDLGKHPNIVAGRDLIAEGSMLAIVMEYIEGGMTLRSFMDEWTPSPREALRITAAFLDGLAFAHESGVLHRDLKPENVLLNPRTDPPTPMITDFGLAGTSHGVEGGDRMTQVGAQFGTPGYLAFEQWTSATLATPRSDLYSVGVMLAEMLGVTPIAKNIGNIADSINVELRDAWLAKVQYERLRAIVDRATAIEFVGGKVEEHRYPSARAMLADVLKAMEEFPPNEARVTPRPQPPKPEPPPHATGVADADGDVERDASTPEPKHVALSTNAHLFGTHIDEEEEPSRRWWWIGGVVVAALIIGLGVVLWPETSPADEVIASVEAPKVEAPAEHTQPVTPDPIETKVETPPAPIVPVIAPTVSPKPEAKAKAKVEVMPKAVVKPRVKDPKPEPVKVTEAKVTMTKSVPAAKLGDTIIIAAKAALPEGSVIRSTKVYWRGADGGAWQSKDVTLTNGAIETTLAVNAAFGSSVSYYVDVRLTDGQKIKSDVVTTTITQ